MRYLPPLLSQVASGTEPATGGAVQGLPAGISLILLAYLLPFYRFPCFSFSFLWLLSFLPPPRRVPDPWPWRGQVLPRHLPSCLGPVRLREDAELLWSSQVWFGLLGVSTNQWLFVYLCECASGYYWSIFITIELEKAANTVITNVKIFSDTPDNFAF